MSDETTLLPCPFCGGEAYVWNEVMWHVGCDNMSCVAYSVHNRNYYTRYKAIEAWNTRAELGNGTLTAEQVREAIMSADRWEKPMGNTGLTNTHLIIRDDGWQAIADELNELGSGTCEFIPFADEDWSEPNAVRGVCSECSAIMYGKDNYCSNCGRKVMKR